MSKQFARWFAVPFFAAAVSAQAVPLTNNLGGSTGFGENSLSRNDDGSSAYIDLSSVFSGGLNFFGTTYTGLYVNNNGNVTFGSSMSTYNAFGMAGSHTPVIAPFFADIDTRSGAATPTAGGNSLGTNLVYWDLDTVNGVFTATWDDVGYYSYNKDRLNAFQLALIDLGAGDFLMEFRYEAVNWGANASGVAAGAGWSAGDLINYAELAESRIPEQMVDLENRSNVGVDGLFRFRVSNGTPAADVPEPASVALFGLGLTGLWLARRRKTA